MNSSGTYSRSRDATVSAVGERVVLYHRVTKTAIVLNPTGGWMWQQLADPKTAAELARDIRARYPSLGEADAQRDVDAFLRDLLEHSMLSVDE